MHRVEKGCIGNECVKVSSEGKISYRLHRVFNCRIYVINKVNKIDAKPLIIPPLLKPVSPFHKNCIFLIVANFRGSIPLFIRGGYTMMVFIFRKIKTISYFVSFRWFCIFHESVCFWTVIKFFFQLE